MEARAKKAEKDVEELYSRASRLRSEADRDAGLLSEEMGKLFHRLDAVRKEVRDAEERRDALLSTDWALDVSKREREAHAMSQEAQERLLEAREMRSMAEEAQASCKASMEAIRAKEASLDSLRHELRLARESVEADRESLKGRESKAMALAKSDADRAKDAMEAAGRLMEEARTEMAAAQGVRKAAKDAMGEVDAKLKLLESRQHALRLAIGEAKRLGAKGV